MNMIICGKDCDDCTYAVFNDDNKAVVKIHCSARDKDYYYGQSIQCDDKEKKK